MSLIQKIVFCVLGKVFNGEVQASSEVSQAQTSSVTTGQTGQIVGNRNTHVYHVPGQARYSMKAANAVYFNTEAEAQAAGYRKAQR